MVPGAEELIPAGQSDNWMRLGVFGYWLTPLVKVSAALTVRTLFPSIKNDNASGFQSIYV
jgi:hypothetical protein